MAEQRYLLSQPCFTKQQRNKVRDWYCTECDEPRSEHVILIVEDRSDWWRLPDRVIAICPNGERHGPAHLLGSDGDGGKIDDRALWLLWDAFCDEVPIGHPDPSWEVAAERFVYWLTHNEPPAEQMPALRRLWSEFAGDAAR